MNCFICLSSIVNIGSAGEVPSEKSFACCASCSKTMQGFVAVIPCTGDAGSEAMTLDQLRDSRNAALGFAWVDVDEALGIFRGGGKLSEEVVNRIVTNRVALVSVPVFLNLTRGDRKPDVV